MWRVFVGAILLLALPAIAVAQAPASSVTYAPGYNMVGGPTGTVFSGASPVYSYGAGAYYAAANNQAVACVGYFAFFTDPTTVTLPPTPYTTRSCALQAGWNLLGNPLTVAANVPDGLTAYYLNTATKTYQTVQAIPAGAAVWVFSPTTQTVFMTPYSPSLAATVGPGTPTPAPTPIPAPITVTISSVPSGPYRVHVGDFIKVQLPEITPHTVMATSGLLTLDTAGTSGTLSCLNDPNCSLTFENQFWTYQATAPGTAFITVSNLCNPGNANCAPNPQAIEIDILP